MSATADHTHAEEHLTIVVDDAGDGWFAARIPEVPGAHGQGRTPEEARASALEAMYELTHEPTEAERLALLIQARLIEPLRDLLNAVRAGLPQR